MRKLIRSLRAFWQRGTRGWADEDVWDFNGYMTRVLGQGIARLMKDKSGFPVSFLTDNGFERETPSDKDWETLDAQWRDTLNQMVRGFAARALLNDNATWQFVNDKLVHDEALEAKLVAERDKGMELFVKYFDALWD